MVDNASAKSRKPDPSQKTQPQLAIERHVAARGLTVAWLIKRLEMSNAQYYGIFSRGSERYDFLDRVAKALGMTVAQLLSPPAESGYAHQSPEASTAQEPSAEWQPKRFLEQRVEELERRVADLERKR